MSQVGHTFVTVRRPLRAYIGSLPHRPPETRPGRPEPPGSRRENPPGKNAAGEPARRNRSRRTHPGEPTPETDPGKPTRRNRPGGTYPEKPTAGNLPRGTDPGEPPRPGTTHGNRSAGTFPRAHPAGGTDPLPPVSGTPGRGWSDPLVCLAGTAPCKRSRNRQKRGGGIKSGKEQKNAKKVLEGTLQKLP